MAEQSFTVYVTTLMVPAVLGATAEAVMNFLKDENWVESGINGFLAGFATGIVVAIFSNFGIKAS